MLQNFVIFSIFFLKFVQCQVYLSANGDSNPYNHINSVLGGSSGNVVETSDCNHTSFGPHITNLYDLTLEKNVFIFHAHRDYDDDRCINFDRQRTEIKTYDKSPEYLKGRHGEIVNYSWKFRLDQGFLPSKSFTHIHQMKPGDGPLDLPIITLTPRKGSPSKMELLHIDSAGKTVKVKIVDLNGFLGEWVQVMEEMSFTSSGNYSMTIIRLRDNQVLLNWSGQNLDLWREGSTFMRPKWGIYRSLNNIADLQDEQIRFADFCLAKGSDKC